MLGVAQRSWHVLQKLQNPQRSINLHTIVIGMTAPVQPQLARVEPDAPIVCGTGPDPDR